MKLLFAILCANPELRATIPEIEENDWMNQTINMNNYRWENVIRDTEFHANNAGNIFREEELPACPEPLNQKDNNIPIERAVKLDKIPDYNNDLSNDINDENKCMNSVNTNKLISTQNFNQLAALSKSF